MYGFDLKSMSIAELEHLVKEAQEVLNAKRLEESQEFEFTFEATNDPRKGTPYVAKLYISEGGKIERLFFDLSRQYGKKEVTVSGTYKAKAGDVLEIRTGGSWKNDYRDWYIVSECGELKHVADISDSSAKARVANYLAGKIPASEI